MINVPFVKGQMDSKIGVPQHGLQSSIPHISPLTVEGSNKCVCEKQKN